MSKLTARQNFCVSLRGNEKGTRFESYGVAEREAIKMARSSSCSVSIKWRGQLAAEIVPDGTNRPKINLTGIGTRFA